MGEPIIVYFVCKIKLYFALFVKRNLIVDQQLQYTCKKFIWQMITWRLACHWEILSTYIEIRLLTQSEVSDATLKSRYTKKKCKGARRSNLQCALSMVWYTRLENHYSFARFIIPLFDLSFSWSSYLPNLDIPSKSYSPNPQFSWPSPKPSATKRWPRKRGRRCHTSQR